MKISFLIVLICLSLVLAGQPLRTKFSFYSKADFEASLKQEVVNAAAIRQDNAFIVKVYENNELSVDQKDVCSTIKYQNSLNKTGWDIMEINTNSSFSVEEQMQCAGFLEGAVTHTYIDDFLFNIQDSRTSSPDQYNRFFNQVYGKISQNAQNPPIGKELFWKTAKLLHTQLEAITEGYNAVSSKKIELWQISVINIDGQENEIDDLLKKEDNEVSQNESIFMQKQRSLRKSILHEKSPSKRSDLFSDDGSSFSDENQLKQWENIMKKQHCSVFFKLLTETNDKGDVVLNDILVAHSTMETFSKMNRIYKSYRVPNAYNEHDWKQMSSYPGAISSTDDFIFKKGQYFVTETSLGDLTESKVNKINIKEVDLLEFIKCQAALMTAKTADQWAHIMKENGRGKMYSSEWMALNVGSLKKGKELKRNSFIVFSSSFEKQIIEDYTKILQRDTFFGSFNNPHNKEVRDYLGYTAYESENKYLKFEGDPRNQIFNFFQPQIVSLDKLKWLMQHNPFNKEHVKGEPVFESPYSAIGARGDIIQDSNFGEVDSKIANLEMLQNFRVLAISGKFFTIQKLWKQLIKKGPSHQEQVPFNWEKTTGFHQGQPLVWDFDWVDMKLSNE